MVQVEWTKKALSDLHEVYEFIAKDSLRYAQLQVEKIQEVVLNLTKFPASGRKVPEFTGLPYREVLLGNYRIIYRITDAKDCIIVMAILHGRQLINKLSNGK